MAGIKWYPLLVHSEESECSLYDREVVAPNSLIVCQEREKRKFALFSSITNFAKFYIINVRDDYKTMYEIIIGDEQQKPYFDLDAKVSEFSAEEASTVLRILIVRIKELLPMVADEDILIFTSSDEVKNSYHVVVDRWCFPDNRNNKAFFERVLEVVPEKLLPIIDQSMYSSKQQFRLYLSKKYLSNRRKVLDERSTWKPSVKSSNEKFMLSQLILASLVSNSSTCKLLPNFARKVPKFKKEYGDLMFQAKEYDEALVLFAKYCGYNAIDDVDFPFSVKDINGGIIVLIRNRPFHCKVCERVHEHENIYLTLNREKDVRYYCRRANNEFALVGNITPAPVEVPKPLSTFTKIIRNVKTEKTTTLSKSTVTGFCKPTPKSATRISFKARGNTREPHTI